jgi:hypothetical protein
MDVGHVLVGFHLSLCLACLSLPTDREHLRQRRPRPNRQERLGHSRPDILLNYYVDVLDESEEMAAAALSTRLGGAFSAPNRLG